MTIIPFAAARCIDCKAPVAIVRRTVEVPCGVCLPCSSVSADHLTDVDHTHAIPLVGPVDEDGIPHECATLTGVA